MKPVTMRKIGGDDAHSWAVVVGGRVKWNGMSRQEAKFRKEREEAAQALEAKYGDKTYDD
jgi:hypothetical protein